MSVYFSFFEWGGGLEVRINKNKQCYNGCAQVSLAQSWNDQRKVCTYFIVGSFNHGYNGRAKVGLGPKNSLIYFIAGSFGRHIRMLALE